MMGRSSKKISSTSALPSIDAGRLQIAQEPLNTNDAGLQQLTGCWNDKDFEASEKNENQPDERRVLLAITVEIEDGRMELMSMREGDSAEEVASKFCRDHSLSDRFVAPLTEHIVSNLKDISNEDINASGPQASPGVEEVRAHPNLHSGSKVHEEPSGPHMSQKHRDYQDSQWQSNKTKICDHKICSLSSSLEQQTHNVQKRKLTNHHVLPSFASLAKAQNKEPPVEQIKQTHRSQLSEKAKAVYMRLYVEFLRHKQRLEEEKKLCVEQYFERLERDRPSYSKKTKRIMLMRGRAAKQFKNYGELLYQEGLSKEEEKKKMIEKKQLEVQENELKAVTAKPEISKLAKHLKRSDEKFWERLSNDRPRLHLQELRHESMETKLMECTFRPQINRSQHGDQDNFAENVNRFDQLFWDAENRRRRQAEYTQWYPEGVTFRPLINKGWQSGNNYGGGKPHEGSVFNRLLQYASKMTEKKQKWQQNETKLVDPTTGQELFRPQTGRKPYTERNADALPIGDFLYQLKSTLDSKKRSLAERNLQQAKKLASCQYVSDKSSRLLEHLKERSLQQIFDYLDSDKDGYVELNNADTKQLSDEVVDDIEEVKKLGSISGKRLSFEKFVALMMSIQKKKKRGVHLVLKPCRKHPQPEKFPFQFKMDGYSRCLASSRRRFGNSRQWYRLILSDRERRQAKIEAMRKEKENQELAECTFRPSLHGKNCKGPARLIHGSPTNNYFSPRSTVVEKEQQEMHGFIFQEVNVRGPDSLNTADGLTPLSLLQSLKKMVSKSAENQGEKLPTNEFRRNDFYLSGMPEV